ncbi:hypothetical protein [Haloquadratum walsbyi]|uniref:Uncharacterized protein n=1 Tax=Haloquadratum walsbyi J07HQW2 TaxID=1238425 RepID=U1NAE7_9EURY|nr:hypothetical protein [Haloquadratum walsbyi]ERG93800.1 MAG: hypothetical protein J07HQW2_00234 [Haloquadratum walsbyi J07HQW2]
MSSQFNHFSKYAMLALITLTAVFIIGTASAQTFTSGDEIAFSVSEKPGNANNVVVNLEPKSSIIDEACQETSFDSCSVDDLQYVEYTITNSSGTRLGSSSAQFIGSQPEERVFTVLQTQLSVHRDVIDNGYVIGKYTYRFENCVFGEVMCSSELVYIQYTSDTFALENQPPDVSSIRGEIFTDSPDSIQFPGAQDPEGDDLIYHVRSTNGDWIDDSGNLLCNKESESSEGKPSSDCDRSITAGSGEFIPVGLNSGDRIESRETRAMLGSITLVVEDSAGNEVPVSITVFKQRFTEDSIDLILRSSTPTVESGGNINIEAVFSTTSTISGDVQYRFKSSNSRGWSSWQNDNTYSFTAPEKPRQIVSLAQVSVAGKVETATTKIIINEPVSHCVRINTDRLALPDSVQIQPDKDFCKDSSRAHTIRLKSITPPLSGFSSKTTPDDITVDYSVTRLPDGIKMTDTVMITNVKSDIVTEDGREIPVAIISGNILFGLTGEYSDITDDVGFTIQTPRSDKSSDASTGDPDDSSSPDKSVTFDKSGQIFSAKQSYSVKETYTAPNRFVDGSLTDSQVFENGQIPPMRAGLGKMTDFTNIRGLTIDNTQQPAVIESDSRNDGFNIGLSYIGVPTSGDVDTFDASLDIAYALQTSQNGQLVDLTITDKFGRVIDPIELQSRERLLQSTVSADYDTNPYGSTSTDVVGITKDTIKLTTKEQRYLTENNELYIQFETPHDGILLLFESNIQINSKEIVTESADIPPGAFDNSYEFEPATFDAQFDVVGSINDRYETYDYRPRDPMYLEVTVENSGDLRVTRTLGVYDFNKNTGEVKAIGKERVTLDPESTERLSIEHSWKPYEYGNHIVRVFDITDGTSPEDLRSVTASSTAVSDRRSSVENPAMSRDESTQSQQLVSTELVEEINVYVFQPATFEVVEIIHPDNWLIHENFDTRVVVQNIGDLDGAARFKTSLDEWSDEFTIPETAGGNVRESEVGAQKTIFLDRESYDYSPSYPTRPERESDRPRSPYGSTEATMDISVTTVHPFAQQSEFVYNELKHTMRSPVRIYKMEIMSLEVEKRTTDKYTIEDGEWYASGYPYYSFTDSQYWSAGHYATEHDIIELPANSLPTFSSTQFIYAPLNSEKDPSEDNRRMSVRALIANNGTAETGIARVRVVTDTGKQGLPDIQTVGTAGIHLDSYEYQYVDIPVVISNNENNYGVHNIEVQVRTTPDYIRQTNPQPGYESQQDAMSVDVNIELWEDFISQRIEMDSVINEQCEGYNPSTPDRVVNCRTEDQEQLDIAAIWKNVGGVSGTLLGNVDVDAVSDPSGACYIGPCTGSSRFQSPGQVELFNPGSGLPRTSYWNNQAMTISPESIGSLNADLPFTEPGVYRSRASPHRSNNEDITSFGSAEPLLPMYEVLGFAPRYQHERVKVLDITDPASYISSDRVKFDCKSGSRSCDQRVSSNPFTIWEGGSISATGKQSVDNVRISKYEWRIHESTTDSLILILLLIKPSIFQMGDIQYATETTAGLLAKSTTTEDMVEMVLLIDLMKQVDT